MSDCINCAYYDDENTFCTYSSIWKEITITVKDCSKYKRTDWKDKRKDEKKTPYWDMMVSNLSDDYQEEAQTEEEVAEMFKEEGE